MPDPTPPTREELDTALAVLVASAQDLQQVKGKLRNLERVLNQLMELYPQVVALGKDPAALAPLLRRLATEALPDYQAANDNLASGIPDADQVIAGLLAKLPPLPESEDDDE